MKLIIKLLISIQFILNSNALNIHLNVSLDNSFKGPENMGIGMGHCSIKGNWNKFVERLGVNSARLFVDSGPSLRKFIFPKRWGQNLNGMFVESRDDFIDSIKLLRTPQGRNFSADWANPVKWDAIYSGLRRETRPIYGSSENTVKVLNDLGLNTVLVQNMGCSKSATTLEFISSNSSSPEYWTERWELYKHSYALAVWAYERGIKMLEFYNEPDLELGECLDAHKFKDYYFIRSLSIQDAYNDCNRDTNSSLSINVLASAFSRKTYGGDSTRYLGDVCVQNNNYRFDLDLNDTDWSNMHMYSYHTYGKTGSEIQADYEYIKDSIKNDTNKTMPILITEHNSHTSLSWNDINSTPDSSFEASRLASQIINLVAAKIHSQIVFKFSITSSFASSRDIAKNGLHWGELTDEPFHLSDTTLSAEAMRLLTRMKQSTVYSLKSNDTSKFRTYMGSQSSSDPNFFYLYMVNDKNEQVSVSINISELNLPLNSEIFVEEASSNYWGEISSLIVVSNAKQVDYVLRPFSTSRFTIQLSNQQKKTTSSSTLSCTLRAGNQSDLSDCSSEMLQAGTSNTNEHENTSVILLDFNLNSFKKNQKTLLKLRSEKIKGNSSVTLLILGIGKSDVQTELSWNGLKSILNELESNVTIDKVSKNFINWDGVTAVVGHISVKKDTSNQTHLIEISEYVNRIVASGGDSIRLIMYRPFRHEVYQTNVGPIQADNLAQGSIVNFYSNAELIHYWHSGSQIEILNKTSLSSLVYENSLFYELSNLGVNSIEPATFHINTSRVRRIFLNSNNLSTIYSSTFNTLLYLEELYLNENQITTIESNWIDNLPNLKYLNLNNNRLVSLDGSVFTSLFNLLSLKLAFNQISSISDAVTFSNMNKLGYLNLSHNGLTRLDMHLFERLTCLKWLDIESNRLILVEVGDALDDLSDLELVCLYDNPISTLAGDSLQAICRHNKKCQVKTNEKCFISY